MARRGFFAELQRQARIAQRDRERREREAIRYQTARLRELQQTERTAERSRVKLAKAGVAAERSRAKLAKAGAARQKLLVAQAKAAHIAAREMATEKQNLKLEDVYADIDELLKFTLSRDDYVDLNTLRIEVHHPAFDRADLEEPIPEPSPLLDPLQPTLQIPEPPRGLISRLFGKGKYAAAIEQAKRVHEHAISEWEAEVKQVELNRQATKDRHAHMQQIRLAELDRERVRYADECRTREEEAAAQNRDLEELISNLGYGAVDAVQEYVSIVLSNSVYPDHFSVTHEFEFDPENAELDLRVEVPAPDQLPTVKAYKYVKASDEIVATLLSQKDCRERYKSAVYQIALRSLHEVFESDRRGLIRTISLEVGTIAIDPGTGRHGYIPFVIAAAERDSFLEFDLSAVVPEMTLARLSAAVSKNPYSLAPANRSGVRRR